MRGFLEKRYAVPDFWYGVLAATLVLLPFMRIRIDYQYVELSGASQFIVFVVGFFGLTLAARVKVSSIKTLLRDRATVLLGLWCIYSFASVFWGEYPLLSLKRAILAIFPAVMVYLAAALVLQPEKVAKGFVIGLAVVTAVCVVYALVGLIADLWNTPSGGRHATVYLFGMEFSQALGQRLFHINGELIQLQRFSGFFPNPNGLGLVAATCVLLLLGIRQYAQPRSGVLLAIMFAGVILSGSRSAVLFLTSGFLYSFLCRAVDYRFVAIVMVIGALSIPGMIVLTESGMFQFSPLPVWVFQQEALTATTRGTYLLEASRAALTHWIFGGGFGVGAELSFGDYAEDMAVHSVFLNAIIETGVVGLALLLVMWINFVFAGSRMDHVNVETHKLMVCVSAALMALFVAQSVDLSISRFHYIHLMFFFLLGLVSSFQRVELEKKV
ncbi:MULTISPECIES: O-antigen ligase [Thalassospira]|uniref:O-antigen ligase-related domain-containing protein n=1 Tax=Thalassospira profundimaris TaxID=502049 RepID=A0A367VJQ3_9PROT|nr:MULTISPECIES: O-antigen ligase family protein [Thalassospira]KZB70899.1 hypothetical protein AUQ43_08595 [Thalassospira sp. MCCC 1A01148]MBR9899384.1 O-antigen ligase family protein [Rhodospirillales bacterium]RCK25458.1 hypothetical protein TH6_02260 [Thalassospira profundimaris]